LNFMNDLIKKHPSFKEHRNIIEKSELNHKNCGAGWRSTIIQYDNKERPCTMFETKYATKNFDNIELRRKFYNLKAPNNKDCKDCPHLKFCKTCICRGWTKANKIGIENCNWALSNDVKEIMKQLK